MKNWRAVCLDGFTKDIKAKTREEAVGMLLTDSHLKKHIEDKHPEFGPKTCEDKILWVTALVQLVV